MTNTDENESVDKKIGSYLKDRRGRLLQNAELAELEHVVEDEKTAAARSREERKLVEHGKINPIPRKAY